MDDPPSHMAKMDCALQIYKYLLNFGNCGEVCLFASFKLAEIDVEAAACRARETSLLEKNENLGSTSGSVEGHTERCDFSKISLIGLKRCVACYSAEIDSLGTSFEAGCELDVQSQHIRGSLMQWKYVCGEVGFSEACKDYEGMFHYRKNVFGVSHCHVSLRSFLAASFSYFLCRV